MSQTVGEFAVVGQDDQALTLGIQSPDDEKLLVNRNKVKHRRALITAMGFGGRKDIDRLVERDVNLAPVFQR